MLDERRYYYRAKKFSEAIALPEKREAGEHENSPASLSVSRKPCYGCPALCVLVQERDC
jgi:hypothetical protein